MHEKYNHYFCFSVEVVQKILQPNPHLKFSYTHSPVGSAGMFLHWNTWVSLPHNTVLQNKTFKIKKFSFLPAFSTDSLIWISLFLCACFSLGKLCTHTISTSYEDSSRRWLNDNSVFWYNNLFKKASSLFLINLYPQLARYSKYWDIHVHISNTQSHLCIIHETTAYIRKHKSTKPHSLRR